MNSARAAGAGTVGGPMDAATFFVVVPFFQEAGGIRATLEALAAQTDRAFSLVLVDNGSTDGGAAVVTAFGAAHPDLPLHLIAEPQKGTGAAADTGFRYAIARGARWIARTDADCLPRTDWIANLKRAFGSGLEFVAGKIKPRTDDLPLTTADRFVLPVLVWLAERYGKLHRRGRRFRYPYILAAGNNLAITADLYLRAGGFPRTRIEDEHEDRVLSETVRTLTANGAVRDDVVVLNSVRRVRAYGYLNTLRWYRNHGYRHAVVDVR
jgi:glycosyltransferase involved in cell wall biosynthesis